MRTISALIVWMLYAGAAVAQEVAVPSTPVTHPITEYRITGITMEREPQWRFVIAYRDNNGDVYTDEHVGATTIPNPNGGDPLVNPNGADVLIATMMTANLSQQSLMRRLLQHLVAHGKIPPATISGTPEVPGTPPPAPGPVTPDATLKAPRTATPPKVKK